METTGLPQFSRSVAVYITEVPCTPWQGSLVDTAGYKFAQLHRLPK
jgi:hypothetical protein